MANDKGSLEEMFPGKTVKDLTAGTKCFDSDGKELNPKTGEAYKEAKVISASELIDQADAIIEDTTIGKKLEAMTVPKEIRDKKYPVEVEITHLKHPVNGRIFEVNPDLIRNKELIPCDEDGKKVYDNRRFGRFN
jgi:hypothetical protein